MDRHPSGIKLESWLVSAGRESSPGAPLNVPPIPASNFIIGRGREYARDDGTPTWEALEEVVGGLESGKAVAFASGMAAIASVFDQLTAGAAVVLPDDCYQRRCTLARPQEVARVDWRDTRNARSLSCRPRRTCGGYCVEHARSAANKPPNSSSLTTTASAG